MPAARRLALRAIVASGGRARGRLRRPQPTSPGVAARRRIWDVRPGTPVGELPDEAFVDPACGTNGGPPGLQLGAFENFARCRAEACGLREIWFRYDDELEYIARAARDPDAIARSNAMVVLGQPVILSLLVDPAGLVQGYRIITDPHAEEELRMNAYTIAVAFKARFGADGWACEDLPPATGETPIAGTLRQGALPQDGGRPEGRGGEPLLLQARPGADRSQYRAAHGEPVRKLGAHGGGRGRRSGEIRRGS